MTVNQGLQFMMFTYLRLSVNKIYLVWPSIWYFSPPLSVQMRASNIKGPNDKNIAFESFVGSGLRLSIDNETSNILLG